MSFFILWGSYPSTEERGIVADDCSACGRVNRFHVADHYKQSHLFFIPSGSKTLVSSTRRCLTCGLEAECDTTDYGPVACALATYACILPMAEAAALPLETLLQRTNPRLARIEEARQKFQAVAQQDPEAVRKADSLIRELAPSFPGVMSGLFWGTLYTALCCAPLWLLPEDIRVTAIILFVVFGFPLIGGITVYRTVRQQIRTWFHKRLIPRAEKQGVDLNVVALRLGAVDSSDPTVPSQVRMMAGNLWVLQALRGPEDGNSSR